MKRNTLKWILLMATIPAIVACSQPAAAPAVVAAQPSPREANKAAVQKAYQDNVKKYAGNTDMLVLPGVLANRVKKQIVVQAEATGLGKSDPIEFFAASDESGNDYETLTVAFAKPGDVRKALEFIGMQPGRTVDFSKLCFWAKGERILATASWKDSQGKPVEARFEDLLIDARTNRPLPKSGLVFTGSRMVEWPEGSGKKVLAADAFDPHSIASNYNEPQTLMDVPRQAVQGDVYRSQILNPNLRLPAQGLVDLILRPEYVDGRKRVMDLTLDLGVKPGTEGAEIGQVEFRLRDPAGKTLNADPGLNALLQTCTELVQQGHDPFVAVNAGEAITLKAIAQVSRILSSIETDSGIRIEPPGPGQLFYRAFMPNEAFRNRDTRSAQPWELHLTLDGGKVAAKLVQIEETWKEGEIQPDLKIAEVPLPDPASLKKELDERTKAIEARKERALPVILVYAQPGITFGTLMKYLGPVQATHPTIHVFLPVEGANAGPAAAGAK